MKGWAPDGRETELRPWQEQLVRSWMECRDAEIPYVMFPVRGRLWGKSAVTATISRLEDNKTRTGEWFPAEEGDRAWL